MLSSPRVSDSRIPSVQPDDLDVMEAAFVVTVLSRTAGEDRSLRQLAGQEQGRTGQRLSRTWRFGWGASEPGPSFLGGQASGRGGNRRARSRETRSDFIGGLLVVVQAIAGAQLQRSPRDRRVGWLPQSLIVRSTGVLTGRSGDRGLSVLRSAPHMKQ
jgi:hypothetical protein